MALRSADEKNQPPPEHWTPEYVRGWRQWSTTAVSGLSLLCSITTRDLWTRDMPPAYCQPRWNEGKMKGRPHMSPEWQCKCGYYSLKPGSLIRPDNWPKGSWSARNAVDMGVMGWVNSWGSIIETEHGYRSEHIKIDSFIMFDMEWCQLHYERNRHAGRLWTDEAWQQQMEQRLFEYEMRVGMFADRFGVPVVMYG